MCEMVLEFVSGLSGPVGSVNSLHWIEAPITAFVYGHLQGKHEMNAIDSNFGTVEAQIEH